MIKSTLARLLLITTGLLLPQIASAEDDLLLYVFQSGQPLWEWRTHKRAAL